MTTRKKNFNDQLYTNSTKVDSACKCDTKKKSVMQLCSCQLFLVCGWQCLSIYILSSGLKSVCHLSYIIMLQWKHTSNITTYKAQFLSVFDRTVVTVCFFSLIQYKQTIVGFGSTFLSSVLSWHNPDGYGSLWLEIEGFPKDKHV